MFVGVASFQYVEQGGNASAINKVSQERRQQGRSCTYPPIDLTCEDERKQGQRSQIPPDQSENPAPGSRHGKVRCLITEKYAVAHADACADQQMKQKATWSREVRGYAGNVR